MKLEYIVLCESAIINQQTQQVSLINIVEGLEVNGIPAMAGNLTLVASWTRTDDKKHEISSRFRIIGKPEPSMEEGAAKPLDFTISVPEGKKRARVLISLSQVVIDSPKEKRIILQQEKESSWKAIGEIVIPITLPEGFATTNPQ